MRLKKVFVLLGTMVVAAALITACGGAPEPGPAGPAGPPGPAGPQGEPGPTMTVDYLPFDTSSSPARKRLAKSLHGWYCLH
jgi:hypothetical protein